MVLSLTTLCSSLIERKRFYKQVHVYKDEEGTGWYSIKLDHRNLHTPLRKLFLVPTEGVALAAAEEWQAQKDMVCPSLMHITSLCNTVLDQNGEEEGKVWREEATTSLLNYASTDTLW